MDRVLVASLVIFGIAGGVFAFGFWVSFDTLLWLFFRSGWILIVVVAAFLVVAVTYGRNASPNGTSQD